MHFYHWVLQVHVKKSLLSLVAYDAYLAQRYPAEGASRQTDKEMATGRTLHHTLLSQQCGAEQPYIYQTGS